MTRLLICGLCPLPFENTRQNYGPGIRTWQFAAGLAQAGHRVTLLAMKIPGVYGPGEALAREIRDGIEIERLDDLVFMSPEFMARRVADAAPRALVGATIYGSLAVAQTKPELPFWADQFGHVMAEAQAKAALEGGNWPLAHFWRMVEPVLRTADKVSTVSERQRYAAIGELGAAGRLNAETCGYELVATIPCAAVGEPPQPGSRVLRGTKIPEDAFIVLWSGSYNTWSDVETLFRGVERAMDRNPRVHFVSTGGAIQGHDTKSYERLESLVAASRHLDRWHLEGWVRSDLVPAYVSEADLGVLTELPIYEGMLGSKNRVLQWMGNGLPVAYNRVGDLGDLLASRDLGLTFAPGDSDALGDLVSWSADHAEGLKEMAARARREVEASFSFAATTRPLQAWAAAPCRAPDAAVRTAICGPLDYAAPRQRAVAAARRILPERNFRLLSAAWRHLVAGQRGR